jgi:hypothetical protein
MLKDHWRRYDGWVKGRVSWCGETGRVYVGYIPMFKTASKILLGKIFCLS